MADFQNTNTNTTNTFNKGMLKDTDVAFNPEGVWTHARNAVNNTVFGQVGVIGNEPSNKFCLKTPYTIIGLIALNDDRWVVFSTDDVSSEVGIFDESECSYKKIVNDRCLNFRKTNLITGVTRFNFDCTRSVYFTDKRNPDRVLNLDNPPYKEKKRKRKKENECYVPEYTTELDCEALRIAPLLKSPCLNLSNGISGGSLPNGSYQITIAYSVNSIKVTDYFTPSNVQSIFSHSNVSGSIEVGLSDLDENFNEFELVLISTVNSATSARLIGTYSINTKTVLIDKLDDSLPPVNINEIPLITPKYDKSDGIFEVNGYLIRTGVYTKFDFNYQPQANSIVTKWVEAKVPADYYVKGGNYTSYMRDEVYSFFIRWVYNTGEKSASYHIPGRGPTGSDLTNATGVDALENKDQDDPVKKWQVKDTSEVTSKDEYDIVDATVTKEGLMSYWESSESYPDDKPEVWGNLCGKKIRHHKFPDNPTTNINTNGGTYINLLGVKFEGITHPLDGDGNPIQSIVGYEILRGSREGNRTIIGKGLLNNMGEYDIDPDVSTRKGLYSNYPFNDLRIDPFLSKNAVKGGCSHKGYEPMGTFKNDIFSFHSPETNFRDPYLNPYELKIHGELSGSVEGNFNPVFKHPEHKMLTDFGVFTSVLVGSAIGLVSIMGKGSNATEAARGTQEVGAIAGTIGANTYTSVPGIVEPITGLLLPGTSGIKGGTTKIKEEGVSTSETSGLFAIGNVPMFTYFLGVGSEQAIRLLKTLIPYFQYAYQYDAHGFYNNYTKPKQNNTRRRVLDAQYISPNLQEFGPEYRINNLFRNRIVAVRLDNPIANTTTEDNSRVTIGNLDYYKTPKKSFTRTTAAYYASLKIKMPSQYGQIDSILQIPITSCVYTTNPVKTEKFTSPVLFGGDVYINRYTEKNSFFFFNSWLYDQLNGAQFEYMKYVNVPYPRYWIDTTDYNVSSLIAPFAAAGVATWGANKIADAATDNQKIINRVTAAASVSAFAAVSLTTWKNKVLPNDYAHLDRSSANCNSPFKISFSIKDAYFYLFANGVRDFFVESEINLAQRDWGEPINERHYDSYTYTDLQTLFRSDIIKSGNYYKYDYSLSVSRLFNDKISWGYTTGRDFNPLIAESCYSYYSSRAIYSLPQSEEQKRDNWRIFLANNYSNFDSEITTIKGINSSGAIILFRGASPVMFAGVDQLQTQNGIKVTIGDGGLFTGTLQNLTNAEGIYEQGSCQSLQAALNTPLGLFWVSQNQGRVFQYANGLREISRTGMKWWFAKYLPSYLLRDFPSFALYDNPVSGVGVMLAYDNVNEILYLTKKDYKLKDEYVGRVVYNSDGVFKINSLTIRLTDPNYFDDVSFTASYDPKANAGQGAWVSFHDWHPSFIVSSRNHFMSVDDYNIWKHNERCDSFCNFYGRDYPFEIEYVASTGQEVATLKSIEYQLECYKYANDCRDVNHVLDFNFDRAVIHNTEQVSGDLKLVTKSKSDPIALLDYPIVRQSQIDIAVAKEENKYRFNQFYDITRNRGELTTNYEPIWETQANGYIRSINSLYTNYGKNSLQHKRFRHYMTKVLLKREVSGDIKMLFRLSNNKITKSFR
jgi:hypothetical protein